MLFQQTFPGFDIPILPISAPYSPPSTAPSITISIYEITTIDISVIMASITEHFYPN